MKFKKILKEIKVHLLSNDSSVVVFRVPFLSSEMADHIGKQFREIFPKRKCMIMDKDTEIEVIEENEL